MVARVRHILVVASLIGGLAVPARSEPAAGVSRFAASGTTATAIATVTSSSKAATPAEKLAKVRAAFVLQIIRFTRWPDQRFEDERSPVVVGVPRGAALVGILRGTFRGRTIDERPIVVLELDLPPVWERTPADPDAPPPAVAEAIARCHVVYLPGRQSGPVRGVWPTAREHHVLVVAEDRTHLDHGAGVTLPVVDRKVRLVVNRTCLEASDVSLSSRVMKLAEVVDKEVRP